MSPIAVKALIRVARVTVDRGSETSVLGAIAAILEGYPLAVAVVRRRLGQAPIDRKVIESFGLHDDYAIEGGGAEPNTHGGRIYHPLSGASGSRPVGPTRYCRRQALCSRPPQPNCRVASQTANRCRRPSPGLAHESCPSGPELRELV
jgi:hypothetical protein